MSFVWPRYPRPGDRSGLAETIKVRATIGQLGQVLEVKFLNGSISLLPVTSRAMWQWSYRPTLLDKRPVEPAGRHDRIPAATISVEDVKSASIPQWTTLDVSPLKKKGTQQLPAHGQMVWPCVAGPKYLLSRRPVRQGKSRQAVCPAFL